MVACSVACRESRATEDDIDYSLKLNGISTAFSPCMGSLNTISKTSLTAATNSTSEIFSYFLCISLIHSLQNPHRQAPTNPLSRCIPTPSLSLFFQSSLPPCRPLRLARSHVEPTLVKCHAPLIQAIKPQPQRCLSPPPPQRPNPQSSRAINHQNLNGGPRTTTAMLSRKSKESRLSSNSC